MFQMFLALFAKRPDLRQDLREEVEDWARYQHKNLRLLDFQAALPPGLDATTSSDNKALLDRAVELAFEADQQSDTVDRLGILYGCLAPLIHDLREAKGKK